VSVDRLLDILVTAPCYLLLQRKTRGQILYHLPTSRLYKVSLGLTIVFFTGAILVLVIKTKNGWTSSSQLLLALGGLIYPLFFLSSLDHFAITEAGLYYQGRFIEWKDLYTFQWKEEGDYKFGLGKETYILGLNVPGDSFPQWLERYKFQRDQREDIDKLLSQYLPRTA
jgi:uncharacterized membrane protein YobD (UPF0266 family)